MRIECNAPKSSAYAAACFPVQVSRERRRLLLDHSLIFPFLYVVVLVRLGCKVSTDAARRQDCLSGIGVLYYVWGREKHLLTYHRY